MKKTTAFILFALFIACNTKPIYISQRVEYYGFDFTKYRSNDFLITPDTYLGKYESVGLVSIVYYPGAEFKKVESDKKNPEGESYNEWRWICEEIDPALALDKLYKKAVSLGADAIVNFEYLTDPQTINYLNSPPLKLKGLILSGFAIKRIY